MSIAATVLYSAALRDAASAACRWIRDEDKARVPMWKYKRSAGDDGGWLHPRACAFLVPGRASR